MQNKLAYEVHGTGSNYLVCLHGFLESKEMWSFMSPLENEYSLLCIDLPGHGDSPVYLETLSMEFMAEKVKEVMDELSIQTAAFIGHSMGGYVSLALADLYPNTVSGIFLLNSTFLSDSEEKKANRMASIKLIDSNKDSFVRSAFPGLFMPDNLERHKEAYKEALKIACTTAQEGIMAAQRGMAARPDRRKIFLETKIPKAIVIGKKDQALALPDLLDVLPMDDAWLKVHLLDTAHMSHIEETKATLEAVSDFAAWVYCSFTI